MVEEPQVDIKVWDVPTRLFHWLVVALLVAQAVTGYIGGETMRWHVLSGYAMLTLIVYRILWGFVGSTHARFASFMAGPAATLRFARRLFSREAVPQVGHNPLGGWNVLILVTCLALQVLSGLFANDGIGTEGPLASLVSIDVATVISHFHRLNIKVLLVLSVLHVIAVLYHEIFKKERLTRAMFTGVKTVPAAALRERRDATRVSPRRRAASREHALAYYAGPRRIFVVLIVSVAVAYLLTRGYR